MPTLNLTPAIIKALYGASVYSAYLLAQPLARGKKWTDREAATVKTLLAHWSQIPFCEPKVKALLDKCVADWLTTQDRADMSAVLWHRLASICEVIRPAQIWEAREFRKLGSGHNQALLAQLLQREAVMSIEGDADGHDINFSIDNQSYKMKKIKTYVLMIAKTSPAYMHTAGLPTNFAAKILAGQKIHTIRKAGQWAKRIAEVEQGRAVLSLRQWEGAPYRSKQVELKRLTAADGVGVQELDFFKLPPKLAENDGLDRYLFADWFRLINTEPCVIIHFTPFRYYGGSEL